VDVNECRSNNGGCSQDCINTRGAYHCTCSDQYYLEANGRTCIELPPRCPRMKVPDHGDMECTQNLNQTQHRSREQEDEALIAENGRGDLGASGRSANRSHKSRALYNTGSTCVIRCNKGYKLVGDSTISCGRSGLWIGEPATCIRKFTRQNVFGFYLKSYHPIFFTWWSREQLCHAPNCWRQIMVHLCQIPAPPGRLLLVNNVKYAVVPDSVLSAEALIIACHLNNGAVLMNLHAAKGSV
jgi:hypothetical protein